MKRATLFAVLLCAIAALPVAAQDYITTDDAWVDHARPDEAIGAPGHADADRLRIVGENQPDPFRSYMKFTVTGSGAIGTAELILWSTNGGSGYELHQATSDSWDEGTITWNNQPGFNPTVVASGAATPNTTEFRLDVSSVVTGDGTYSFVVIMPATASNPVDAATFESKDAGGTNPPTLRLTPPGGGPKTIVYIRAGTSAYDTNVTDALGANGITVDGVDIPGLGYQIDNYAAGSEPQPASAAGDLIFISQSVSSGNVLYHTDETIPIVCTESGLYDDDAPPRSEMFFSERSGESPPYINLMRITNNTHPITSIFPLGDLEVWHPTNGDERQGWMNPPMAPGVVSLAYTTLNPTPTSPSLAIADVGAQLLPGGQGAYTPAPSRRVVLGYQGNSMNDPTSNGIYLLQRCVQWAMGDPVTAGGATATTPTAPLNLTARAGDAAVELQWQAPPETVNGYRIYQADVSGGPYTQVAEVGPSTLTRIVTGLTNGTPYFFVVTGFNAAGEGPDSNEATATPQAGISLRARTWREYK